MKRQSQLDDIYGVKSIKSNPLERDNDVPESGFRHSDAYHRYFRGYTEIRIPKGEGRFEIQRYYTQPWIVSAASDKEYWCKRIAVALLLMSSWAAYVWGLCLNVGSNRWWVTTIPGLVGMIGLFVFSVVAVSYIFVRRKMTLWEHASTTKRMKIMSAFTGGCMGLTVIAKLAYLFAFGGEVIPELLSSAAALAAALAAVGIHILERKTVYTTVPNETVLPEGEAYEIW